MMDDRGIADAFYTILSIGIVVIAGIALSALVLNAAGQQGSAAADQLNIGADGLRKGIYGLYYTIDPSADLNSADPAMIPPAEFVDERIDPTLRLDRSSLPAGSPEDGTAIWTGYILMGDAGDFTFELESAGGSWLWIDGTLVIDNHGIHTLAPVRSMPIHMTGGYHRIKARYVYTGYENVSLNVRFNRGTEWVQPLCYV